MGKKQTKKVIVYYPTGELALGEEKKIKRTLSSFIPTVERITGYNIILRKANKALIKRCALMLQLSKAFLVSGNEIFFSPLYINEAKELLLHELGHIEWFKRFGRPNLPKSLVAKELFGIGIERIKSCLMGRFIIEIGASYLVLKWGQEHFRKMIESEGMYLKRQTITAPECVALIIGELELLKYLNERGKLHFPCKKVISLFSKAIAKSCSKGYYIRNSTDARTVYSLIKLAVMLAVSIVDNDNKPKEVEDKLLTFRKIVEKRL